MTAPTTGDETVTRVVATARAKSRRKRTRPEKALLGLAGILTLLVIWEVAALVGWADARFLPPPTQVIPKMFELLGNVPFWVSVGDTMAQWGIGLLIALVFGTVLGVIIGLSPFLRKATNSTIEFLRPIPSVALIPLASLLYGVRPEASLLLIVYACFWQILIQVMYGVNDVDQVALQTGRSYAMNGWQRVRHIVFPTMLPFLMTGVRLAAAVALILAITAQLIIGTPGLGKEIANAQNAGLYSTMYALILITGFLGVLVNVVVRLVERWLLSWHASVRGEVIV